MLILHGDGNLGRDAEFKTTQSGGEFCSFAVATSIGYGDRKETVWVDVTKWGKGAEGLARILRKGSKVAFAGEFSQREHNGKTYVQCRADHVSILGTPDGQRQEPRQTGNGGGAGGRPQMDDDLSDDIPFARNDTNW
jgi:single-strand DNA-binding protein